MEKHFSTLTIQQLYSIALAFFCKPNLEIFLETLRKHRTTFLYIILRNRQRTSKNEVILFHGRPGLLFGDSKLSGYKL